MLSNTYAVSAKSGQLRWKIKGDRHRDATSTAAPKYFEGRLYIPVSSLEVVAASNPAYECCTFRDSVISVDAATGKKIWKSYTIEDEAVENGKNEKGAIVKGPSGAPIWSSPAIDTKRGLVYVATGQNYSTPADGNSDAIIAFNMETGEKVWVAQQTENDAWNTACFLGFPGIDNANCPPEDGPDYDFGSHPILMQLPSGRDVVVGGQKSGAAMGVDPDSGKTLWKTQVGRGGILRWRTLRYRIRGQHPVCTHQ
jgi:polyvinyl alcohol dehydrogenase (cytochrome)